MEIIRLAFPAPDFKYKTENGKRLVFDPIRKKYVVLTPEEWVRQNLIGYFLKVMHYSPNLISVEKKIIIDGLSRRYDIVVYNASFDPYILVECKEPRKAIVPSALYQLIHYYKHVPAPYWILTNGNDTFCAHLDGDHLEWQTALPEIS